MKMNRAGRYRCSKFSNENAARSTSTEARIRRSGPLFSLSSSVIVFFFRFQILNFYFSFLNFSCYYLARFQKWRGVRSCRRPGEWLRFGRFGFGGREVRVFWRG
ncbi:hypothetical protein A4A49_62667 [Nicotiana attenuata]|uniref:Uncharacterized protein n=1 Tax=Nicotiana attenuata TaxID=49451 RepID=A0A1J6I3C9_NICAT|nr:hypothetical protein A4A49_62667 [Nicotiana attenuata]